MTEQPRARDLRAVGAQAVGQGLTIVTSIGSTGLLGHVMTSVDYARFLTIWTFVIISSALVRLGLNRSLQREVPLRLLHHDREGAHAFIRSGWALTVMGSVLFAPVLLVLVHVFVPGYGWWSEALLLVVAISAFDAFRLVGETVFRGLVAPVTSQATGSPLRAVLFFVMTLAPVVAGADVSLVTVLRGLLVANVVTVAVQLVATARAIRPHFLHGGVDRRATRLLLVSAPLFLLIDASNVVLGQGDVLVASLTLGAHDTATYGVAVRLVTAFATVPVVMLTALGPRMAHLTADRSAYHKMVARYSLATFGVTAAGVAVFLMIGRPFIRTAFGATYLGAFEIVLILSVGVLVNAALLLVSASLVLQRREQWMVIVSVASAVAEMVVAYPVASAYGPVALACVSSGATVVNVCVGALVYWRGRHTRWPDQ